MPKRALRYIACLRFFRRLGRARYQYFSLFRSAALLPSSSAWSPIASPPITHFAAGALVQISRLAAMSKSPTCEPRELRYEPRELPLEIENPAPPVLAPAEQQRLISAYLAATIGGAEELRKRLGSYVDEPTKA